MVPEVEFGEVVQAGKGAVSDGREGVVAEVEDENTSHVILKADVGDAVHFVAAEVYVGIMEEDICPMSRGSSPCRVSKLPQIFFKT